MTAGSGTRPRPRDELERAPPGSLLRIWVGSSQLALIISPAGALPARFSLRLASDAAVDVVAPGFGQGSSVVGGESIWQRVL